MMRLSSSTTGFIKFGVPIVYGLMVGWILIGNQGHEGWEVIFLIIPLPYLVWFGSRLSDVWLDGDDLLVKARVSFRVPLAEVQFLKDVGGGRSTRVVTLGLDHPVGKITEVRFVPKGTPVMVGPQPADILVKDLRVRINTARAERKA